MSEVLEHTHIGHKIRRIRELKGIKQESLAADLGISRQSVSKIEQSETIDDEMLDRIAKVFGIPIDAIKNFNEDAVINIISSTLYHTSGLVNYNPIFNFNPVDKLIELYERILESERSKNKLLEDLLQARDKK